MNQVTGLRALLLLALACSIAAGSIDVLVPHAVPETARESFNALLEAKKGAGGSMFLGLAAAYELLVLAALVGMFLLRRWGVLLGLLATALTLVQAGALGPHAYSGLAFMVSYAGKVAWGAALALAWVLTSAPALTRTALAQSSTST